MSGAIVSLPAVTRPVCNPRPIAAPSLRSRGVRWLILGALGWSAAGGGLLLSSACRRADAPRPAAKTISLTVLPSQMPAQTSETCRECHPELFAAWQGTDHALANMPADRAHLAAAFAPTRMEADGGTTMRVEARPDGPHLVAQSPAGDGRDYAVAMILGYKPSRQMLVEIAPGRLQAVDLAWDARHAEWFNVFGDQGRREGEWGHWTGRGMNWNSMCAQCHMTGYRKGYDAATDTYHSTWVEHGIGCIQCHGPTEAGHGATRTAASVKPVEWLRDRQRTEQTCAYCHARNEALTAEFPPGASYDDHFRLTLPTDAAVFWPDGQQRDEDFNWTSVRLSRMHHAGVTCLDCHDPHTTKTILPAENNQLCLQCHTAPGRSMPGSGVVAPAIDPTAHSHHAEGSTGNQCISCHMPTTNYMMRSPRHDHGWLKPDPLLTRELGIPNACNRCHTDQAVDWSIEHATAWYGDTLDSRQRQRARALAVAQAGAANATQALLDLLATEDIPGWQATVLQLLAQQPADPAIATAATPFLHSADAMVRSAAVQVLTPYPEGPTLVRPLLDDAVRLVRLDAAWALPTEVAGKPALARELQEYMALTLDQPGGQLRRGQYLANLGRLDEAAGHLAKAATWDRFSPGIFTVQARILQAAGQLPAAAAAFYRAAQLEPENGAAMFDAGLAYAEAGLGQEAEHALELAVQRTPTLDRAWYNLGLARVQRGATTAGLAALSEAERLAPGEPSYPYAIATVYWQHGDRAAAQAAAHRALAADPNYAPALRLLR